jgi:hypothetical protein
MVPVVKVVALALTSFQQEIESRFLNQFNALPVER